MNRLSKARLLDGLFVEVRHEQFIRIKIEAVSLGSTTAGVHSDRKGVLSERSAHRQDAWRMEHQRFYRFLVNPATFNI